MSYGNLFRSLEGKEILPDSPLFKKIHRVKHTNEKYLFELNNGYHTSTEALCYLEKMTGSKIDQSVSISLPFYTDFGAHISFGKNIFINQNVTFVDLGGIVIEDDVLIGPMSRIITVNHLTDPKKRRGLSVKPVKLRKNVWIAANVTVLPGVTIGENSIVAADATVTKDVPANVIVAGSPARIIKRLES